MVRRGAGVGIGIGKHTFRATGITAYLKNGGTLENAEAMATHSSPRRNAARSRIPQSIRCGFSKE